MTPLEERAAKVREKGDVVGQHKALWLYLDSLTDEQRETEEAEALEDDAVDVHYALNEEERAEVDAWHAENHANPGAPRTVLPEGFVLPGGRPVP